MIRRLMAIPIAVALLVSAGCDTFYGISGRALEAGEGSFQFFDNRGEFEKRLREGPRIVDLSFFMYEKTDKGPRLWTHYHSYHPVMQESEDDFTATWGWGSGWGSADRIWDHLLIESTGYESIRIPGEYLTREASKHYLLLRFQRKA